MLATLAVSLKLQQKLFEMMSKGGEPPSGSGFGQVDVVAASAAGATAAGGVVLTPAPEAMQLAPLNEEGECEAVNLLIQRDLQGTLSCIRASGCQVIGGMSVSSAFAQLLVVGRCSGVFLARLFG